MLLDRPDMKPLGLTRMIIASKHFESSGELAATIGGTVPAEIWASEPRSSRDLKAAIVESLRAPSCLNTIHTKVTILSASSILVISDLSRLWKLRIFFPPSRGGVSRKWPRCCKRLRNGVDVPGDSGAVKLDSFDPIRRDDGRFKAAVDKSMVSSGNHEA